MNSETDRMGKGPASCLVHVPESRFEADIITQALEREGIPVLCRVHEETAYDGLFIPQRGWGSIFVPTDWKERALEIVRDIMKTYHPSGSP